MQKLPNKTPCCDSSCALSQGRGLSVLEWSFLFLALLSWVLVYYRLKNFAIWITTVLFGLDPTAHIGSSIVFFIYDVTKIFLLLALVTFGGGLMRSLFTPKSIRRLLYGRREFVSNMLAAMFGTVTPFCSCSALPLFIGFITSGIPLGVAFSFLISAPMVNEIAIVLLYSLTGWKITALYIVTGLAVAIGAGWVIGRLRLEGSAEDWVRTIQAGEVLAEKRTLRQCVICGLDAVRVVLGKIWIYVVVGIALGACIHGYLPEDLTAKIMGKGTWWSVPMAVLVGIPMYCNATGIIFMSQALLKKGAALGTVLAFMMSVITLSLPEILILRKVLKPKLISVFVSVVGLGIILVGYMFNMLL